MDGILNLDKPAGPSSAACLNRLKRLLPRKTKIGHAGTLDPFATGVLLVLIGRATKLCEQLMDQPKAYETTIKLGARTETDDCESVEIPNEKAVIPTRETIAAALPAFLGNIQQRPPNFSAMKVGGRRAYALARGGNPVELPARTVRVDAIELISYEYPLLRLSIACGRGTYIRSLARDLGEMLGTGGHLTQLRRTRVGAFYAERAITMEKLAAEGVEEHLQAMEGKPIEPIRQR